MGRKPIPFRCGARSSYLTRSCLPLPRCLQPIPSASRQPREVFLSRDRTLAERRYRRDPRLAFPRPTRNGLQDFGFLRQRPSIVRGRIEHPARLSTPTFRKTGRAETKLFCTDSVKPGLHARRSTPERGVSTGPLRARTGGFGLHLISITSFSLPALRSSIFLVSAWETFSSSSSARFCSSWLIFLSFSNLSIASLISRRMLRTAVR